MVNTRGHVSSLMSYALCVALVIEFFSMSAWAQGLNGRIKGTTADASGGTVPGAEVVLTNVETNLQRTVTTDAAGAYVISSLPPGQYQVQVSLTGFQTVKESLVLALGEDMTLNFALKVGSVTESVEVTAEALAVQT